MCEGDKRELRVPHQLAYGNRGTDKIPGGLALIFEVELVKIHYNHELSDLIVLKSVGEEACTKKSQAGDRVLM